MKEEPADTSVDEDYESRGIHFSFLNHIFLDRGFSMVSRAFPIRTNPRPVMAIITPGGIIHHQRPREAALEELASCKI